ncbi:radical SAM protein [Bradyrhizobium yuanmingense]|uniref:radical SAM protein n=1 Tax=Bradyrhizobium yuanmingense TaxID=108015 RepID=UPI001FD9117B|nr:radical SAM protein [Bradyrhizobium yuanmingense]
MTVIFPLQMMLFPRTVAVFLVGAFAWRSAVLHRASANRGLLFVVATFGILLGGGLKRHEVEKLAAAGVRWIQPGIESLDTRVLKLMRKGTASAHNVLLLKWCRQYGVRVSWSLLWGFPGESDAWYAQMASWLPLLHHLQPGPAVRLRYQRYSPYHHTAEKHGLR